MTLSLNGGVNPGGGLLTSDSPNNTVQCQGGIATFFGLCISAAGQDYFLTASGGSIAPSNSNDFNIGTTGNQDTLQFENQPTTVGTSAAEPAISVAVLANGQPDITYSGSVTIALEGGANPGGGELNGNKTAPVQSGIATFTGLSVSAPGQGYFLQASSASLQPVTSSNFNVGTTGQDTLEFDVQPSDVAVGNSISPPVEVDVLDSNGDVDTNYSGSVTLALSPNPSALGGDINEPVDDGVATFTGLTVAQAGEDYTLAASSGSLPSITSDSFNVTAGNTLVVTGEPPDETMPNDTFSVTVTAKDPNGNVVTSFNGQVTLSLPDDPGGGTLDGNVTATALDGVVTFSGLSINDDGDGYVIQASADTSEDGPMLKGRALPDDNNISPGNSDPFDVDPQVTLYWGGAGDDNLWSNADNWEDDNGNPDTPDGGYDLDFPDDADTFNCINDMSNLSIKNIEIDAGYSIQGQGQGNSVALDGEIYASAGNSLLTMGVSVPDGSNLDLVVDDGAVLALNGVVSGGGGLQKDGAGELDLTQVNTYTGQTTLDAGNFTLASAKALGSGTLAIEFGQSSLTIVGGSSKLMNALDFEGGIVTLNSDMTFTGGVNVGEASTLGVADGATATFGGTSGISGSAVLTSQGPGTVSLNCPLSGDLTESAGTLELHNGLSNNGTLTVTGGTLTSTSSNTFEGTMQIQGGTVKLGGTDPLGTAAVTIAPSGSPITIDPQKKITLDNTQITLQGGTLDVLAGVLLINGEFTATGGSEIDTANGAQIGLAGAVDDSGTNSTLTIGDIVKGVELPTGYVTLYGTLTTNITDSGIVHLANTFNGSGNLTVNNAGSLINPVNAELDALFGVADYSGTVNAQSGTVLLGGTSPLGTGELDLGGSNNAVTLDVKKADTSLGNSSIVMNGGTITVKGEKSTINSAINVQQDTTLAAAAETTLANVGGTAILSVDGTSLPGKTFSEVKLTSMLNTQVTVANRGVVEIASPNFSGSGSFVVNGGALSSKETNSFSGSVQLQAGKIVIGANNAFGTGALSLSGTGSTNSSITVISLEGPITLSNAVTLNGGTVTTDGTPLIFSGLVTVANATTLNVAGSSVIFASSVGSATGLLVLNKTGKGQLGMAGVLYAITLNVNQGTFVELPGFELEGGSTVNNNGGKIIS